MSLVCESCDKDFLTNSNLLRHKKTSKKCVSIPENVKTTYDCDFCLRQLSSRQKLTEHLNICSGKKAMQQFEKKEEDYSKSLEEEKKVVMNQSTEIELLKCQLANSKLNEEKKDIMITNLYNRIERIVAKLNEVQEEEQEEDEDEEEQEEDKKKIAIAFLKCQLANSKININSNEEQSQTTEEQKLEEDHILIINNITILSRPEDNYINATQLCQAGGKKFNDWFRSDTIKVLINVLSFNTGIPALELVETKRGGNHSGSWIHPDLGIQLAQWINPTIALQVSGWIRTLFSTGKIEIKIKQLKDKKREIDIKDKRIKMLENKCLKRHKRVIYPEHNVVYIVTSPNLKLQRIYLIGKAEVLENRLSSYNKSENYEVVHYRECKSEDEMKSVENMVLTKLNSYREVADKDRFVLPEDQEINLFTEVVDNAVAYFE